MKAIEILEHFKGVEEVYEDTLYSIDCYNEAIAELEALENRSCDSCKHSEFDAVFQTFYSSNESIFCYQCSNNFTSKWESR